MASNAKTAKPLKATKADFALDPTPSVRNFEKELASLKITDEHPSSSRKTDAAQSTETQELFWKHLGGWTTYDPDHFGDGPLPNISPAPWSEEDFIAYWDAAPSMGTITPLKAPGVSLPLQAWLLTDWRHEHWTARGYKSTAQHPLAADLQKMNNRKRKSREGSGNEVLGFRRTKCLVRTSQSTSVGTASLVKI